MNATKATTKKAPGTASLNTASTTQRKSPADEAADVQRLVHLLQVSQIELEHQNQELRLTEQELAISRDKYVTFFDFSPIPYFSLNTAGEIVEGNLIAGRMLGVDRGKLIGKQLSSFIPIEEKRTFAAFLASVFASPLQRSCKLSVVTRDKRTIHALLEAVCVEDAADAQPRCQLAMVDLRE